MSNTPNYDLYLTDTDAISFLEWRKKINGTENSNMMKIDAAVGNKANKSTTVAVTLTAAGWDTETKTQTVTATGVTETANCIVTAAPASYVAYGEAWVRCTAQGAGTLTFACETVPTEDLTANVLILG